MHKIFLLAFVYWLPMFVLAQSPQYFSKNINTSHGATMCLDASGNVWLGANHQGQIQLIQLHPDGTLLDQTRIDIKAGSGDDLSEIIADSEGMIVGCGNLDDDRGFAFRYDPSTRKVLWATTLESLFALFNGIVENGPGGNFVAYNGLLLGGAEMLTLNRTTGALMPAASRRYDLTDYRSFNSMLLHKGSFYATGYDLGANTELRISNAKIRASDGAVEWSRINHRDNPSFAHDLLGQDILVDNDSVVTLSLGGADGSGLLNMIHLQKQNAKGDLLWVKRYDLTGTSSDIPEEVVRVADGYIVYGRSFLENNGLKQGYFFLLKTDRNGNPLWARHLGKSWEIDTPPYYSIQSQIIATADALYSIAEALDGTGQQKTFFFKTDLNGNIEGCDHVKTVSVEVTNVGNFLNTPANPSPSSANTSVPAATSSLTSSPNLNVQTGCSNLSPMPQVSITCPANLTLELTPGQTSKVVNYAQPGTSTTCFNKALTLNLLKGKTSGSAFNEGSTEICYEVVSDSCDIRATCCFRVDIQATLNPCEAKTSGCLRFELFSIQKVATGNRTYRIRLVNQCSGGDVQALSIQLPNGVVSLSPGNNSIYTAPSGRKYEVRNPNSTPFYSIRFKAQAGGLPNGSSDYFEYQLPQQSTPAFILMNARLADGTSYQAHLSTSACPVENAPNNKPQGPTERYHSFIEHAMPALFPNPTNGNLLITLPADWQDQGIRFFVSNAQGQRVQEESTEAVGERYVLTLESALVNGFYYITLQSSSGGQTTLRCVLQR